MKKDKRHIPIRSCISCRAKRNKEDLIRLVLDAEGMVARDESGKARGRGAYVCASEACLEKLKRDNRVNRALRKDGPLIFSPGFHGATEKGGQRISNNFL